MRSCFLMTMVFALALVGCSTVRAPRADGAVWNGRDPARLTAQIRAHVEPLPTGWVLKVPKDSALGAFAYRKHAGSYVFSESGYFTVDAQWRNDRAYSGVLEPGGRFCVLNPKLQADVDGQTVRTHHVYDYCVELQKKG